MLNTNIFNVSVPGCRWRLMKQSRGCEQKFPPVSHQAGGEGNHWVAGYSVLVLSLLSFKTSNRVMEYLKRTLDVSIVLQEGFFCFVLFTSFQPANSKHSMCHRGAARICAILVKC